jgi:hypothetical protein
MKQFKNSISVTGEKHHIDSFIEDLKKIGYKVTGSRHETDNILHTGWNKEWDCMGFTRTWEVYNTVGDRKRHVVVLPSDWSKALELASEEVKEELRVGNWVVSLNDTWQEAMDFIKKGKKVYQVFKIDREFIFVDEESNQRSDKFRKATPEEIEKHLISEGEKRGLYSEAKFTGLRPTNNKYEVNDEGKTLYGTSGTSNARVGNRFGYNSKTDTLYVWGYGLHVIYEKGKWAELVPSTPSIEKCGHKGKFESNRLNFNDCAMFDSQLFIDLAKIFKYKYSNSNRDIVSIKIGKADFTLSEVIKIANHFEGGK